MLMAPKIMIRGVCVLLLSVALAACAGRGAGGGSNSTNAEATAQGLVDSAEHILQAGLDGERGQELRRLISQARGAMIVPGMGSVSFLFSLGGGNGLMLAQTDSGWTGPAFLTKGTGGLGMQAGVTRVSGIILYMRDEDVRYVLETGALLQGRAAITFLDADFEGNRTPEFVETGDVIFVGQTEGLYAGIGVSTGGLSNRTSLNAAYHRTADGSPEHVLYETGAVPEGARILIDMLERASAQGREATKKDGTEAPSN
ncbi:lipid-binding SYLF domain-containing protein [Pseudodesulfovibrio pelocollis]|uniref:lipid-binding SYLF domain-containing protein n=1 Tax=Pseudodesulfovibrio pelocollis TaxID=3051432 RepID=UPI00255B28C1|nr:lipid-binding SYLF domain-containing protein [Pseudodesulfovibrio sp. SB368]